MKIPKVKFDLERHKEYIKETNEKLKKGEIIQGEQIRLYYFSKQKEEIQEHFYAVSKIIEEHNIPITFDYHENNFQVLRMWEEELRKEIP